MLMVVVILVSFTYYIDRDYAIKKYFDIWQNLIFDKDTGHINYYNEYTCDIHILALDASDNDGNDGRPLKAKYQCTLLECTTKLSLKLDSMPLKVK